MAIVRVVIIVVLLRLLFSPVEYAFVAFPLSGLALLYLVCYFCQLILTIEAHFSLHFHHFATIFNYKSNSPTHLPRVERAQKSPPNGRAPGKSGPKRSTYKSTDFCMQSPLMPFLSNSGKHSFVISAHRHHLHQLCAPLSKSPYEHSVFGLFPAQVFLVGLHSKA